MAKDRIIISLNPEEKKFLEEGVQLKKWTSIAHGVRILTRKAMQNGGKGKQDG